MTNKKQLSDAFPELQPNLGLKLFRDRAAEKASTRRAYFVLRGFVSYENSAATQDKWRDNRQLTLQGLCHTSARYWSEKEHDDRATAGSIKAELGKLKAHADALVQGMESLSPVARRGLSGKIVSEILKRPLSPRSFNDALLAAKDIQTSIDLLVSRKASKRTQASIRNACGGIVSVRERLTNKPFLRSYGETERGANSKFTAGKNEFASLDALFVQAAMQAIDPTLELPPIKTGLRAWFAWEKEQAEGRGEGKERL
ncbi:hypothetical protein [Methylobacterium sp. WL19]|uniref:hypothetical protein n=1 Tax=Methylobacterium sp. WL19 TaxID=2603896 RepID=UPI0011C97554|nr:hypothetical protein [Methylobacterium sp. WL19]TXN33076.1 hypothetical protein FV220_03895 [Methylobacterium sp. WL19]